MDKDRAGIIFLVIMFILIILVGVFLIIKNKEFIFGKDVDPSDDSLRQMNFSYIKFRGLEFGTMQMINVNYEVYINKSYFIQTKFSNGSKKKDYIERITKLKEGRTHSNAFEMMNKMEENSTFLIYMWDDDGLDADYYPEWLDCKTNETCETWLKKQAKINITELNLDNGNGVLGIQAFQGKINNPAILFSHKRFVENITLENSESLNVWDNSVFSRDKNLYFDEAFKVSSIDDSQKNFYFHYDKNEDVDSDLKICVIDSAFIDKKETFLKSNDYGIPDYCLNTTI